MRNRLLETLTILRFLLTKELFLDMEKVGRGLFLNNRFKLS